MAFTDIFGVSLQYSSIPASFLLIILISAVTDATSLMRVLTVVLSGLSAVLLRAVTPPWAYDYLAFLGLLSPLLGVVALAYYGLDLLPLAELSSVAALVLPLLAASCAAIPASGMRFTDALAMEGHMKAAVLAFVFITVIGVATEPESLRAFLVLVGVISAAVGGAALAPRWVYDYAAFASALGLVLTPAAFITITAWEAFELPAPSVWWAVAGAAWPGLVASSFYITPTSSKLH